MYVWFSLEGYAAIQDEVDQFLLPIFILNILENGVFSEIHVGHLDKNSNFILTDEILEEIKWKGMCVTPIILTQDHGSRSGHGWTSFQLL